MWREIKVLLIDDNEQRRHDLKVILDFLGEEAITAGSDDWRQRVDEVVSESSEISAVLLGDCLNKTPTQAAEDIISWDAGAPILFTGDTAIAEEQPDNVRRAILASVEMPPSYNKLLDSLHRCQVYREQFTHNRRDRKSVV